jgi:F420H(2)-dependent quinone reductase
MVTHTTDTTTTTTDAPKLPPVWFKHLFWRGHRSLYHLLGDRVLWTPESKRGWGAMHVTTLGRASGERRSVILGYIDDDGSPVVLA